MLALRTFVEPYAQLPHEAWAVFVTIDNMAIPIDATLTTVVNDPIERSTV